MTINLDSDISNRLSEGMRSGSAIELPFPVAYAWALNGQAGYKSQGAALYYGGWACKVDDIQAVAEQRGNPLPSDWKQVTIASRDGDEYDAYTTRHLIVAPIGKRESWLYDGRRVNDYVEGGRRHLQVLAYLAESKGENGEKTFIPWGPIVLSAKGYQARNILNAFSAWDKATSSIRRKVAPGVPAWCFYLALGTFGKERQVVNVGKPGAQSPITPISAYIPDNLGEDAITGLFVGQEVAAEMADLSSQANEWINAWKQPAEAQDQAPAEDGYYESGPFPEEIPF
jgi:hypothetical protein